MSRFTHIRWNDVEPGTILDGTWLPPRQAVSKTGDPYWLGEIEHANGLRTGFTQPVMLREKTKDIPVGVRVRIRFDGPMETSNGRTMMTFSVRRVSAEERI
jgi:hypothetical protein